MKRHTFKQFLNVKVHSMARVALSGKMKSSKQSEVDRLVENFNGSEPSFENLEEAKKFLSASSHGRLSSKPAPMKKNKKNLPKKKDRSSLIYLIAGIIILIGAGSLYLFQNEF